MQVSPDVQKRELIVPGIRVNPVGQKNIDQSVFRICPGIRSGKSGMSETGRGGIPAGRAVRFVHG
jgi:hypothetical protein